MSAFSIICAQCSDLTACGKGGQKTVYRATHPEYGRIAIKEGKYSSISSLERITREVELLKSLNSHYFPKNYEFVVDAITHEFVIVEEFLEAQPLSNVKERFRDELSIVTLLKELITGLQIIWSQRIVHRDLKPDNLLITESQQPKIIDFGIARFLDEISLTHTMALMGPATPMYASPEQLANQKDQIDHRSDFFSLGIIAAELHLRFHPFHPDKLNNSRDLVENIMLGNYYSPSNQTGASPAFIGLIRKLLQVHQYKRFRNFNAFNEYLEQNWSFSS